MKYFSILQAVKNDVRFHMFYWKWPIFLSFPLFKFTLVIKLRNFGFKSHWNTLIFLPKKYNTSDLNMSHGKMSDFASFPLFGFTLVMKLKNFDFENHWNTLVSFDIKKSDVRFKYAMSSSVWFGLSFVVSVEIWQ